MRDMKVVRTIAALGLGLMVSACATTDTATRSAPFQPAPLGAPAAQDAAPRAPYADLIRVNEIRVQVPQSLRVSEANRYYPGADIVWRGDPVGDRYAQVKALFDRALARGVAPLNGAQAVDLEVRVLLFHALTEKARYTTGGVHSIAFELTLTDAATGATLVPARRVKADLPGFGGQQAIDAEARGETQKVRITQHLADVIHQELMRPAGAENRKRGLLQAVSKI